MKKTVTNISGLLALSFFALPAVACTNLKTSEAQKAPYQQHITLKKQTASRNDLILPLNHGPRALQFVNRPDPSRRS